jgi:uncharacterized protein YbbK (DUF523 family)
MLKRRKSPIPPGTETLLISACLIGEKCCYDGESRLDDKVKRLPRNYKCLAVCPEVLAGLTVPRIISEIAFGGDGHSVLDRRSKVFNLKSSNITELFIKGAEEALRIARNNKIKYAIMKSNSPSCGAGWIYDGSFSGKLKRGDGVTTALLKREGIEVFSEKDLD